MEVTNAFLEGVEEPIQVLVIEESTKENIEIITNHSEEHNIMEVTEAVVGDVESTIESVAVVEEEELNENTDVFVETEGEDTTIPESEIENDIHTEVLIPSSSEKQSSRRSTPSRPLCAADIENFLTQEQPQQANEQTVFSAIEQEAMIDEEEEENEEDEDKENIQQPQEQVEMPMLKVKSIKSSSSGQVVKRLSSLYLPTKSTLARVAHETSSTTTMRPNTANTNPFSGSQSLKSAMSNTGRSVASVASSASMGHTNNHIRSAGYKSPQARGMCKNTNTKHHNKGFKKPTQPHAAVAVRRGPTIPVTPHFRSDARSKMHYKERPLTTEEREIAAIEIARKMEELRMKKTKKVGVKYWVYLCDILSQRILQYLLTYSHSLSQQTKPNNVRTSHINTLPLSLLSLSHIGLFDGQKSTN